MEWMSLTLLWECNWDLVQVTQLGSNKVRSTVRQLATAISEGYTPSGNVWKVIWRVLYLRNSLSKGTVTTSIKKKSFILVCSWNRWLKRWILIDFFQFWRMWSPRPSGYSVCWGSSCFLITRDGREREAIIHVSVFRAPVPLRVCLHSYSSYLTKVPPPNLITMGMRLWCKNSGGEGAQKFSLHRVILQKNYWAGLFTEETYQVM